MIVDLAKDGVGPLPEYDLCIVGSGPAGLTLAAELADAGLAIAVLESGRQATTPQGDALRQVISEGVVIKDWSRERVLGGASTTWAGLSSPLDPIDFEPRPWLALPGWPLSREELLPFWAAAAARYRFPSPAQFAGFPALRARGDVQPAWLRVEEKVFLARGEPQDFGRDWRHLFEGPGLDLYLDATVVRLERGEAEVRSSAGRRHDVRARVLVLAAGGIENARLLLLSDLGNERDQVGRGFMNHPKNYGGVIELARPVGELPFYFGCLHQGFAGYAGLRLAEAEQRRLGLLNSYVRFEPLYPWSDNRGVEALVLLVKRSRGLFRAWKEKRADQLVTLRDYSETGDDSELQNERKSWLGWARVVGLVALHLPMVLRYAWSRLAQGRAPPVRSIRLRNFMEMEPRPENRVTLAEETDAHGQRLPRVRHDSSALDRRSLVELQRALAEEVRSAGLGRLEGDLEAGRWSIDQDASHHMGATRMGDDPATSVVNRDLRLHGVEGVYCAGGSVFPTSGCANPTFTIVALSIRLAEHLRTEVFARPPRPRAVPAEAALERVRRVAGPARGARRVLVLGAGTRVQTDVLAAFAALPDLYAAPRVAARRARAGVAALASLTAEDLARVDLVYVAVSKAAVPEVLARLRALAPGALARIDLIIDTPVLLPKHLLHARRLVGFRSVSVAEDCVELPWIALLRSGVLGEIREACFDRSAWRYHGLATAKALFGGARLLRATRSGKRVELELEGGGRATILEPRDYARGTLRVVGAEAAAGDTPGPGELALVLRGDGLELRDAGRVVARAGFDLVEQALLGPVSEGQTVSARTEDLKRVGLLRLLRRIPAYPLLDGLEDMLADALLEKRGRWSAGGLFDLRSGWGRLVLPRTPDMARSR